MPFGRKYARYYHVSDFQFGLVVFTVMIVMGVFIKF